MKESDIVYETETHWVGKCENDYTVFAIGITHSVSDSSYEKTDDGLNIAIARCNYLNRKSIATKKSKC